MFSLCSLFRLFFKLQKLTLKRERESQQKMGVAVPLSVFHSMFAPVFGAIAHQFSDLRDPAGKDRLYGYRESNSISTLFVFGFSFSFFFHSKLIKSFFKIFTSFPFRCQHFFPPPPAHLKFFSII